MTALLGLICLAGLAGLIVGVVAVFRPLPKLHLTSRPRAGALIAGSLIALAIAGSLVPPDATSPENRLADKAAAPSKPAPYVIGQPLDIGDFRVIIRSVEERDAVGVSFVREQASTGGVLLVVEYTVENIGDRPRSAFELPEPSLIGPNGVVYERDLGKTAAYASEGELNTKIMSNLNPGIQVNDAKVFEVAKANFDRQTWMVGLGAGGRLKIDIRPDPYPQVAHESLSECGEMSSESERALCLNPDVYRRFEIVIAKLDRHKELNPNAKNPAFSAASADLEKCRDRNCLLGVLEKFETETKDWPVS